MGVILSSCSTFVISISDLRSTTSIIWRRTATSNDHVWEIWRFLSLNGCYRQCFSDLHFHINLPCSAAVATVRLTHWAQQLPTMKLASSKSVMLAGFSLVWLVGVAVVKLFHGEDLVNLWAGAGGTTAWLLVLWSALGAGTTSIYLQTLVTLFTFAHHASNTLSACNTLSDDMTTWDFPNDPSKVVKCLMGYISHGQLFWKAIVAGTETLHR